MAIIKLLQHTDWQKILKMLSIRSTRITEANHQSTEVDKKMNPKENTKRMFVFNVFSMLRSPPNNLFNFPDKWAVIVQLSDHASTLSNSKKVWIKWMNQSFQRQRSTIPQTTYLLSSGHQRNRFGLWIIVICWKIFMMARRRILDCDVGRTYITGLIYQMMDSEHKKIRWLKLLLTRNALCNIFRISQHVNCCDDGNKNCQDEGWLTLCTKYFLQYPGLQWW